MVLRNKKDKKEAFGRPDVRNLQHKHHISYFVSYILTTKWTSSNKSASFIRRSTSILVFVDNHTDKLSQGVLPILQKALRHCVKIDYIVVPSFQVQGNL
jgi:hypothetical protein